MVTHPGLASNDPIFMSGPRASGVPTVDLEMMGETFEEYETDRERQAARGTALKLVDTPRSRQLLEQLKSAGPIERGTVEESLLREQLERGDFPGRKK